MGENTQQLFKNGLKERQVRGDDACVNAIKSRDEGRVLRLAVPA